MECLTITILLRGVRKGTFVKVTLEKETKEVAGANKTETPGERAFHIEGTATAKVLRWENAWRSEGH